MIIKNLLLFNAIIMENTKLYAMYLATDNKLVQNSNWEIYIFTDFKKCNKMSAAAIRMIDRMRP